MKHILLSLCLVLMLRVTWDGPQGMNMGIVIGSYYDTLNNKPYLLVREELGGMGKILRVEYDKVTMSTWINK